VSPAPPLATGGPLQSAVVNSFTCVLASAAPVTLGALSFEPEPGAVPESDGAGGAVESST
jgi:hypothetical protein